MGCPRCKKQLHQLMSRQVVAAPKAGTLSAATLTARGWIKTCYVCGAQTEPAPFPEACTQSCSCVNQ